MQVFPITFKILTICGIWRPKNFDTFIKKYIYYCLTVLICFLVFTFTLSHLIDIIVCANNFEDLAESCFMVLSMLNICCKTINILYLRNDILQLLKLLINSHCQVVDEIERKIEIKFYNKIRFVTLFYTILAEITCILITIRSFFASTTNTLPFRAWIPYEIQTQFHFWIVFFHQTIAHVVGANIQIANDTLVYAMLIQTNMQLQILKNRLKNISNNFEGRDVTKCSTKNINDSKKLLVKCVKYHRCILEYSEKLNNTLRIIIFIQFVVSLLVLCSSVYLLSKMKLVSMQFISLMLYLFCMLYQIFLYCWYGNEIILQSMDLGNVVYIIDWTNLKIKDKKNLLILMLLFCKPIKFTSTFLVTLSIDSYCKILKTSYSIFNLLQRISL
ncbi:PREDICTED: odorant receptor 46a, isoform A-like [Ceratosolen solmsi marchali]|uniref:Odorant receptor n=1 Tax=Ceratosolen solmsi marchali TaxID=326594 RepID=A0AAJ6YSQ0_9HYME|nr:PREDICTED: odorant receptor 46a, isoform A-like [Ceratosolen solmsi marchali]